MMTIMTVKVTVTMVMMMSRMMMLMHARMHALRSFSEDPIIQRHGGKVSRFGVFW